MRILTLLGLLTCEPLWAAQSVYCPANHAYISVGMTQDQVVAACGQPTSKEESNVPLTRKIPVMQLIYNNQGTAQAFYGVWTIPTGVTGGVTLEVDVVNNRVRSVRVNGNGSSAFSICKGVGIVEGDPVSKVYSACGSPSAVNDTFISEVVSWTDKPQIWMYNSDYQGSMRLTFVKGHLANIEQ